MTTGAETGAEDDDWGGGEKFRADFTILAYESCRAVDALSAEAGSEAGGCDDEHAACCCDAVSSELCRFGIKNSSKVLRASAEMHRSPRPAARRS